VVGLAGLIIWALASPFHTDAPPVKIGRTEAEQQARLALGRQNVNLDSSWTVLSRVDGQPDQEDRFVWQTAGRERYAKLLGLYLAPPSWVVRFARFQGDVAERAEEYRVYIRGSGEPFRVSHILPEAKPDKNLTQEEARAIAVAALPDSADFKEVSAQAAKRPARTDWAFVFKDTRDYGLTQGEARVSVDVAGDEVVDKTQFIYVPEEWSRNERARRNVPSIVGVICAVILFAIAAAGAIVGVVQWSRRRPFSVRAFASVFAFVFLAGAANVVNSWPVLASQASTAQPLSLQAGIAMVTAVIFLIFTSGGLALVTGLVTGDGQMATNVPSRKAIVLGISVGLAIAGAGALARLASPITSPLWGNLGSASAAVPFVAAALGPAGVFFTQALILLLVIYVIHVRTRAVAAWMVLGMVLAGAGSIETIPAWLILGVATGAVLMLAYRLVFRHQPSLILVSIATLLILSAIRDGVQRMYPSALAGALAGAVLVALVAWVWFRGSMSDKSFES
jgi:hypothetical protein